MNQHDTPWISVTERLSQIAELDQGKPRKRIVILGAGMAGLTAAYELQRLQHQVSILEAADCVGGRVRTHRFGSGQHGELGAMRIPASHDYTRYYIDQTGLTLRRFVDSTPQGFYDVRGVITTREDAPAKLLPKFSLTPGERQLVNEQGIGGLLSSAVAEAAACLTLQEKKDLFAGNLSTDQLRRLDATSLRSALKDRWSAEAMELLGATTSVETLWSRPVVKYVRDALTQSSLGLDEIVGGMDLLPQRLAAKLSSAISFRTAVLGIHLSDKGQPRLSFVHDGRQLQDDYDYLLCTLPFGVVRRLQVTGLSWGKMRAIRCMSYVSATKVLLHCRTRFWETRYVIFGGRSVSDRLSRQTYYPSDNISPSSQVVDLPDAIKQATPYAWGLHSAPESLPLGKLQPEPVIPISKRVSAGPGVLLGSYAWGSDARRLGAMDAEQRKEAVIASIAHFHPELRESVDQHASIDWDADPWSMGGYADLLPSDLTDYYLDAIRPEGNAHFAGEHLSPFPGWIQGAVYSALRALVDIVR